MKPVSSTSRRGARAAYHDEYPLDFGPRSGREGEKCRPLDHMRHITISHQLCSHPPIRSISTYIQNCCIYSFHVVLRSSLETLHFCHLRIRSSRATFLLRFNAILKSFCPLCGVYWYEIQSERQAYSRFKVKL